MLTVCAACTEYSVVIIMHRFPKKPTPMELSWFVKHSFVRGNLMLFSWFSYTCFHVRTKLYYITDIASTVLYQSIFVIRDNNLPAIDRCLLCIHTCTCIFIHVHCIGHSGRSSCLWCVICQYEKMLQNTVLKSYICI